MGRPDIVLIQRGPGRPDRVFLFEFKREPAAGTTPLKQLAQEAYTQAEQKYLEGSTGEVEPKEIAIYGVGFRGKELASGCKRVGASRPVLSRNWLWRQVRGCFAPSSELARIRR